MSSARRRELALRLAVAGLLAAFSASAQSPTDAREPLPTPEEIVPGAPARKKRRDVPHEPAPEPPQTNVIVPLLMYTPETHVGVGGLFVHFYRPPPAQKNGRVSSLAFLAIGTTRRQAILEAHPDFYLSDEDIHLFARAQYQYFPDSFWGVGPRSREADEERYKRERLRLQGSAHHRVVGPLYAGVSVDVMEYQGTYDDDGIFARENIPGERGGVTSGLGPSASFDTRDNTVAAHSGTLLGASVLWFGRPISRYNFQKVVLEARQFFSLGGEHAIGTRFYGELQGGDVPYYQLAMLGGDELLRGYYFGRYRDETLAAVEAEYRYPLFWKFGGVLFAGVGEVADNVDELASVPLRWAVGAGLRFSLSDSDRLNLRLDVGVGPGTWGAYFTAREAF